MKILLQPPWLATTGLLALGALTSIAAQPERTSSDTVKFRSVADRTLSKRFVQHSELELVDAKVKIETPDGPEEPEFDKPNLTIVDDETIEFEDETLKAGDGRPVKLKRSFATIDNSVSFESTDEGAEGVTRKNVSGLLGKSVLFTWDDEEKAFVASWSGDEGEDALLEPMVEDADFRGWLPGKAVEEDDTWTIPASEFNNLQEPSGSMGYQAEDAEEKEADDPISDGLRENVQGEIKATYKGTREEDGIKVGVIAFEAKLESHAEHEDSSSDGPTTHSTTETQVELEGELLWDLAGGHFRALTCDSKPKLTTTDKRTMEFGDTSVSFEEVRKFEGKKTYRFTCAPKK